MFKVLVCDDENVMHKILNDFLAQFHPEFKVVANCMSGSEALQKLELLDVDVVITDIRMPEINGIELIREIKQHYPECIIIVLSAYGEFEYAQKAMEAGVFRYLLKPVDFKHLSNEMRLVGERLKMLYQNTAAYSVEQMLFELIFGAIESVEQFDEALERCGCKEEFAQKGGGFYRIAVLPCKGLNEWKYGISTVDNMLVNIIKFFMGDGLVYVVAKKSLTFYIIAFNKDENGFNLDINGLTEYIYNETGFNCSIETIDEFDSLYEFVETDKMPMEFDASLRIDGFAELSGVIKRSVDYINENYNKDISRKELADIVHISPEYFSHCFRKETGYTFLQHLTRVRMNKAVELINKGEKISDVIKNVGYVSKNRFYANFRTYTSYTPSEYKRRNGVKNTEE